MVLRKMRSVLVLVLNEYHQSFEQNNEITFFVQFFYGRQMIPISRDKQSSMNEICTPYSMQKLL